MYHFRVKFSDNSSSIDIRILGDKTIGALKGVIINGKTLLPNTRLRLIWCGTELSNDNQKINAQQPSFKEGTEVIIYAVVIQPNSLQKYQRIKFKEMLYSHQLIIIIIC